LTRRSAPPEELLGLLPKEGSSLHQQKQKPRTGQTVGE
jgi:hypothetical protein